MRLTETQAQTLALLCRNRQWRSVVEIARELFIHPNSARTALRLLHDFELVELESRQHGGKGRPFTVYRASENAAQAFPALVNAAKKGAGSDSKPQSEGTHLSTSTEHDILEAILKHTYEGLLANVDEDDLPALLAAFLLRFHLQLEVRGKNIQIKHLHFTNIGSERRKVQAQLYRMLAQSAVGKAIRVTIAPESDTRRCILTLEPAVDTP